ncbi:CinA family protein [Paraburkholderia pallida]|uniref:Ompetence-damaged protein n=1 Tax=Paraburkholderia pallida TaxID=2547399 RepID=A0A4P7CR01_9BURK|nr:CinA family protein [Paraburkholderia pallida]QBQ96409.1 ompetence-damaged protein [Paraburkholderia pallida]
MNISKQIVGYLHSRALVLASIETCTAGAMSAMLADVAGAHGCLDIGVIVHTHAALAGLPGTLAQAAVETDVPPGEPLARTLAEALLVQRAGHANVALASIGWLAPEQEGRAPATHSFAWACMHRGAVVSASETVLFSGRRAEIRRSIARRALLGLPRFVDATLARDAPAS